MPYAVADWLVNVTLHFQGCGFNSDWHHGQGKWLRGVYTLSIYFPGTGSQEGRLRADPIQHRARGRGAPCMQCQSITVCPYVYINLDVYKRPGHTFCVLYFSLHGLNMACPTSRRDQDGLCPVQTPRCLLVYGEC